MAALQTMTVGLLGSTTVSSAGYWVQAKIELTIPKDINVIEIGSDCSILRPTDTTVGYDSYYFLDNFQLSETRYFNFQYLQVQSGDACTGGYVLKAPAVDNASYQWYKDGIALIGRTDSVYKVPDSTARGTYNVRITGNGDCQTSEPLFIPLSPLLLVTTACRYFYM